MRPLRPDREVDGLALLDPPLAARRNTVAGYLSGGERQMLAISIALLPGPRLLLIDEMTLGLAPVVIESLQGVIRGLRDDDGLSFLIVEQNVSTASSWPTAST